MRVKYYYLLAVTLIFGCVNVFGQRSQYRFSHLDISNGLSNNQVNCIFKDSEGFMWFGTESGLNRYDGYNFKVFGHDANNKNSIKFDNINNIFEGPDKKLWIGSGNGYCFYDPETERFNSDMSLLSRPLKLPVKNPQKIERTTAADFWFLYADSGIYRYNTISKKTTHYYHSVKGAPSLYSSSIADITPDVKGNIWIVYTDGMVEMLDVKLNKISYRTGVFNKVTNNKKEHYTLLVDRDGDLWFYASSANLGVFYYQPSTGTFRYIGKESSGIKLNTNIVTNIVQADDGLIWIAADQGGINVLDKKTAKITYLLNKGDDPTSLRENTVNLYKDDLGIIWAGTYKKGISYYHKNIIRFPIFRHLDSDPGSLRFNDVNKFAEDKLGNLWIGTNGGGLIYFNRKTGVYTQYKNNPNDRNSLSSDVIISLCIDHDQKLWIGTYFGGLDCFDGKTFSHYKHDDNVATSIADNRVFSILEDSSHRLWIGTLYGGLEVFDRTKKIFYHPLTQADITSTFTSSIFEDKHGNIWVGGYLGVDVIMKEGGLVRHYTSKNGLLDDLIRSIDEDSRGLMWITTAGGLNVLDCKTNTFISLTKKDGLPDNQVLNILEDNRGAMWLSTSNGLSRITLIPGNGTYKFQFENFDETDGLQGREFNKNAALKTRAGELIFGGADGFNLFDPASIEPETSKPQLIFTDFQLFNKGITANEAVNGHVILSKSISATNTIVLNHDENIFSIEFAALDYINPGKVKYQYILEGFNNGWVNVDNKTRKAGYTNLDAGDYVFKVRVSNSDGVWNPQSISLKIEVLPPFWKSTVAYIIYLALSIGVLLIIRQRGIEKIRRQFAAEQEKREAGLLIEQERREAKLLIEQERQEVKRIHELDELKIKFLTNVSHEFRTPLALIMGPVEKLLKISYDIEYRAQLGIIGKNARRLLNLVNQLLDFRKMEVQELKLHCTPGDIVRFVKESTLSFQDIADEKKIALAFDTDIESLITSFDHDKIERILFNLLSNAFKFTHSGGNVTVLLSKIQTQSTDKHETIEMKIIDTGIGIDKDKQDKIFERFFQSDMPKSLINQGSGIGLAITREFVKMHNGDITIESEPGYGSCFIIRLPLPVNDSLLTSLNLPDEIENEWADVGQTEEEKVFPKLQHLDKKPVVLLVEDNEDFRFYLKDNLKGIFFIVEATNGKEGWQKALSQHPDIMVSDISMPEMNGIDLCKKMKGDKRTSHIPVIMLTALTGEEDQLKGLEIGANDYMTKPFNFEILLSKIRNLLTLQNTFKQTYKKQMNVGLNEVVIESEDEKFLRNVVEYIEQNISNDKLSVEELSRQVNMSRGTLYKKLLTVTGKSPVEFIRLVKLKKAVYLLENSQKTISQISYEVGFYAPKYFTKLFKEEYKILPSDYVNNVRQNRISTKSENK
ncbi:Signal transduction histidine kinase [Mucilaginibacter mallensis]|uniref:histidine kinase n=1 Tax=Mucilaginibacter mallensis TaxID=652787 RepID=A0A1H2AEN2_MUCMA|nr:hybrid sensor histidine kinase/response regulator transcription factor [Mucilaginibacter mallensis]SDT44408.1 Signal transduction histidine kinase [Mucilaginibacter mallensis]